MCPEPNAGFSSTASDFPVAVGREGSWLEGVPVQVHGKHADPFFAEDLEAAQTLVDSTDRAELFLYPGDEHLFADSSLPAYDASAAALLTERVLAFLHTV